MIQPYKRYSDLFVEQKELGITEPATEIPLPGNCHYASHIMELLVKVKTLVGSGQFLMRLQGVKNRV